MEKQIEIEFKTLLSEEEYKQLFKSTFQDAKKTVQRNDYYDTADRLLFKNRKMARIRTIADTYLFTLKTPLKRGVLEEEYVLDEDNIFSSKLEKTFSDLGISQKDLEKVSTSHTMRLEHDDEYGTWCLDLNTFDAHTDYELEYELFPNVDYELALSHYQNVFNTLNIKFKKAKPKYIRSLESQTD